MMFFNGEKKRVDKLIEDLLFEKNNRIFNQAKDELLKMGKIVVAPLIEAISFKTGLKLNKKPIIESKGIRFNGLRNYIFNVYFCRNI